MSAENIKTETAQQYSADDALTQHGGKIGKSVHQYISTVKEKSAVKTWMCSWI